jgi:exodeoxyribonuclease V beta subunit
MTGAIEFDVMACRLDGASLIEASAGTGKTYNICGLYLRLLLERGLDVQQILVVTFTNSATAELRDRIRSRIVETRACLDARDDAAGDPMIAAVIKTLEQRRVGRDAMAKRLDLALQTFDEASIFTIHGFCQRALADTAFASGQAFALELVPDDSDLLMEVVHDFWRRQVGVDSMKEELASYLLQTGLTPQKLAGLLHRHLAKPLAKTLWPDDCDQPLPVDGAGLASAYAAAGACWQAGRSDIVQLLLAQQEELWANVYNEKSICAAARDYDAYFRECDPLACKIDGSKLGLLRQSRLEEKTKKKKTTPRHLFFVLAEQLMAVREPVEQALERARLSLIQSLLREAADAIRQKKREQRLLSYDDILYNVFAALECGDYPWLAESLRSRFPVALIDEFQDTDPLQFFLFNAIYGAGKNTLFLVGDPKQAIYSFRNADLNTYLVAKQKTSISYTLSGNQRSSAGLIDAMNGLFGANSRAFMLPGLDYQPVDFGRKPRKVFQDNSAEHAPLHLWMLPKDEQGDPVMRADAKAGAVNATACEIARLLTAATSGKIILDGRPLSGGDIAVLVRTHAQGGEIKRALAALNIGSVELSQAGVFQSGDAEDVERVLRAILTPNREALLRGALATELIGHDAAAIAAISNDEARMMEIIERFADYRKTWLARGVGFLYRQLLTLEGVSARMLARPDGERRLTNLLHLGERLQQAAETYPSPDALLRWLQTQRRECSADEVTQLRLESDQNLVQIVSIHKSKGLEYPVVFCPFLWDGRIRFGGPRPEGQEYHDDAGGAVIDFRSNPAGEAAAIKETIRLEESAEFLRLVYVALTRAAHRCYLVAGCYTSSVFGRPNTNEGARSLLNWLIAGDGHAAQDWFEARPLPSAIDAAWEAYARNHAPHILLAPLPAGVGSPLAPDRPLPESLSSQPCPGRIPYGWRTSSYSGLTIGAVHENAATDHDLRVRGAEAQQEFDAADLFVPAADDILRFPRGPNAGSCLHDFFEHADFSDPSGWQQAIDNALLAFPQSLPGVPAREQGKRLGAMVMTMMRDVMAAELPNRIVLGRIGRGRRLTELEFCLPSAGLSAGAMNQTLKALGYEVPQLAFHSLRGYLKGFIDLVFEHEGRYYLLDWKSNHLGDEPESYGQASMSQAISGHSYRMQYLLYAVALNRYLARRLAGYRYDSHFGGVLYLFVRGVRPGWKVAGGAAAGVHFDLPSAETIAKIDALLNFDPAGSAA